MQLLANLTAAPSASLKVICSCTVPVSFFFQTSPSLTSLPTLGPQSYMPNMTIPAFQTGNSGCRVSCLKYEILHLSSWKVGVHSFLPEIRNFPHSRPVTQGIELPAWNLTFSAFQSGNLGHRVSCLKNEILISRENMGSRFSSPKYGVFYISACKIGAHSFPPVTRNFLISAQKFGAQSFLPDIYDVLHITALSLGVQSFLSEIWHFQHFSLES